MLPPPLRTALRVAIGALLLAAAALKIYGQSVSMVPPTGPFAVGWIQTAAVLWEVVLGVWLVSGTSPRWSWVVAVVTFALFAFASGYLGLIGQASCGCFGAAEVSPWVAFALDVTVLVALLFAGRPSPRPAWSHDRDPLARWPAVTFSGGILVAAALGIGHLWYGSIPVALARLRGESVTVSPEYLDFGTVSANSISEVTVVVANWSDHPLRLIGGTSDCSCVATLDLPAVVQPGQQMPVRVRVKMSGSNPGVFTRPERATRVTR